ncbi:unnamed protein product, partial [Rotaria sp. Silwood1]
MEYFQGAKSSIHVYKGDLTTQRTDVIAVCSSSEYLFKAICEAAPRRPRSLLRQRSSSSSRDRSLSPLQGPRFLVKENSFSAPRRPRSLLRQRSSSSPSQEPRFLVKENSFSAPRRPRSTLRQRSSSSSRDRSLSPQGSRPVVRENSLSAPRRPRSSLRQRSPSSPRDRSLSPPQGPRSLVKENSFSAQRRPRSSSRQRWPSLTRDGSLSPQGPRLLAQEHPFSAQRPRFAAQIPSLATSPGGSKKVIAATVNKGTIQVVTGDITTEKVDAIIGSSSSKILKDAIIKVAGDEVKASYDTQHENNPNSILISTPSGVLPCKRIFFVKWQPDKNEVILRQSLVDLIGIVIQNVISYKFTSCAFPALGCGQHGCS